jgi:Predicted membrane protein (DUF2079)
VTRLISGPTHRLPEAAPPAGWLRRVRRAGYALLGLQLAGFLAWSTLLYNRFAVSFDFAQFMQSWTLIAHGHLNPYDTVHDFPFWTDHSEFLVWPLALFYWVWPHGVTLLWIQDVCLACAEAVAFTWLCEVAGRIGRDAAWLAGAGLVLIVANPWTWWGISFDFHTESLALPFAALLLWDLSHGRRRAWVWVAPLLLCGDVACTYLTAIGLGACVAGRRARRPGAIMAALGVAAVLVITAVHGNAGSGGGLRTYAYLAGVPADGQVSTVALVKGIVLHPRGAVHALWSKRADLWAVTAPSGLIGLGSVWLLPFLLIVLLENNLASGFLFSPPSFQYLPVYVLMPVGTVAVLAWLARRRRKTFLVLTGLVLAQALAWMAVWLPRTPGQWLLVPGPAAATLDAVLKRIPASDEVVASQGVMGPFAGRADIRPLFGLGQIPLRGRQVWFVIAPRAGIETLNTASAAALIGELAGPLHATLVAQAHGVWAYRWAPPRGDSALPVPSRSAPQPAWVSSGPAGRSVLAGPVAGWHVAATRARGYVVDQVQWLEPAGRYQICVRLSAGAPVNLEVWNDNKNLLLARRTVPALGGIQSECLPVSAVTAYRERSYSGWGPFRATFLPPPRGQRLELRVWSAGHEAVNVYGASLSKAR